MSERIENLIIGTKGWVFDDWVGDFYPEDMPEEWQLDYYSNQFKCTLVAEGQWVSWDSDMLDDILESLEGDRFAFVFEVKSLDGQAFSKLDYIHEKLGELAYGVLLVEPTSEALSQAEEVLSAYRLTVSSNAVHLPGWQLVCQGQRFSGAPLVVVDIHNQALADTRALLESYCDTFSPEMPGGLLIVEGVVSAKDVQDLKLMAELLGC